MINLVTFNADVFHFNKINTFDIALPHGYIFELGVE